MSHKNSSWKLFWILALAAPVCFAQPSGIVWTWGSNSNGQLGNGSTTDSNVPVHVIGLSGVVAVAGGQAHSLALKSDGTVWAWGSNFYGQLGNGSNTDSHVPVQVSNLCANLCGLTNVIAIAADGNHSLALKKDGTVWAWGNNVNGQLGNGTFASGGCYCVSVASQVPGLTNVVAIAAGGPHSLAIDSFGVLWSWGYNFYGQLGNSTYKDSDIPLPGPSLLTGLVPTAIAGGGTHSLALMPDVWDWGNNVDGELGNGITGGTSSLPVEVGGLLTGCTVNTAVRCRIVAIGGGELHSLALKSDGTVFAWGSNGYGQLGNGSTAPDSNVPVQVSGLVGAVAIGGGNVHSLALKSDGTVWTWGDNSNGQLGNGATGGSSNVPVEVVNLNAIAIGPATEAYHNIAIASPQQSIVLDVKQFFAGGAISSAAVEAELLTTLNNAMADGSAGKCLQADLTYGAFIIQVLVQRGRGITASAASTLAADAEYLIAFPPDDCRM